MHFHGVHSQGPKPSRRSPRKLGHRQEAPNRRGHDGRALWPRLPPPHHPGHIGQARLPISKFWQTPIAHVNQVNAARQINL